MSLDSKAVWLAIGWTMLHFLWVGGLIGIATAVALRMLRVASAEVRYVAALAGLTLLALAPAAIGWRIVGAGVAERPDWRLDETASPRPSMSFAGQGQAGTGGVVARDKGRIPDDRAVLPVAGIGRGTRHRAPGLDELVAGLPWLWLIGSPITFAWLGLGLAGAERLRRRSVMVVDGELPGLCRRLAGELGVAREVAVAVCERLATPVLVGVIRPMILLPAVALGGWNPEQIEMVLLHELAHVRRRDNLVNLLQRLVESALFFHPAVWIVSGWVRREREYCCDAVVVSHTGRARAYAETLLALSTLKATPGPHTAVAVARNHLVSRIHRILTAREEHPMKLSRTLVVAAGLAVVAPAFWIAAMGQSHQPSKEQLTKSGTVEAKGESPGKTPAMLEGKPLSDWIAALKDPDPAVRKRAARVLGGVPREQSGDQFGEIRAQASWRDDHR